MKTLGGDRIFGEYREMKFHIGEVLYPRERERERESSFASKDGCLVTSRKSVKPKFRMEEGDDVGRFCGSGLYIEQGLSS